MSGPRNRKSPVTRAVWLTIIICAALLIVPGATVSSMYVNDLLIFLDGGYRVVQGQVPNRDFHTALGPLNFYIPGIGYWLTGRLGLSMPVGLVVLALVIAPVMIHVFRSRLRPLVAVPLAVFLLLLLVTPMNTGETPIKVSFAMFYNRIGWVLLGILLVMHLRPTNPVAGQRWWDATSAAMLTLLAVYIKMTYGVVAAAFLVLMLLQSGQRVWAFGAILLCGAAAVLIEVFWGGSQMHIAELVEATKVSGVTEWQIYARSFIRTSGEYAIFLVFVGLAIWVRPRVSDFLFYGFCACAGFALINQNFQITGIVTMFVGAAVAAEIIQRRLPSTASPGMTTLLRGAPFAVIVLLLPIGLSSAAAIGVHATVAATKGGVHLGTPNGKDLRIVNILDPGQFRFYRQYGETLETGAALLAAIDAPSSRVLVMDFVSPFSSLVGLQPPEGGAAWMHDNRNFDLDFHLPAEEMLDGVDIVMVPKKPAAEGTTEKMLVIYAPYLKEHFELARATKHWSLYKRREAQPEEVPQSS